MRAASPNGFSGELRSTSWVSVNGIRMWPGPYRKPPDGSHLVGRYFSAACICTDFFSARRRTVTRAERVLSTKFLIQRESKHLLIPYRPTLAIPTDKGANSGDFSSVAVHSSQEFLCQGRWYPSLKPGTPELSAPVGSSNANHATPFDHHAGYNTIICAT